MSYSNRVVKGADLHEDAHLTFLVELLESVERGGVPVVDALVGNLKVTDVLQLLDGDLLPCSLFLVESYRLHDAVVNEVNETADAAEEHQADNRFQCLVHYSLFLVFPRL